MVFTMFFIVIVLYCIDIWICIIRQTIIQPNLKYCFKCIEKNISSAGVYFNDPLNFLLLYLAALRYMRRSQSLTPGIQTSSSFSVTAWPPGEGNGCSSGSLA